MKSCTIALIALALTLGFSGARAVAVPPTPAQVTTAKAMHQGKAQAFTAHTPSYREQKAGIVDKAATVTHTRAGRGDAAKETCRTKCARMQGHCMSRTGDLRHKMRPLDGARQKAPQR